MRPFYDQLTAADAARRRAGVPRHEPLCGSHAAAGGAHAGSRPWGVVTYKEITFGHRPFTYHPGLASLLAWRC